ncbi:MAG: methyltransferase domain-containing protein [Chitinivibrionales bacterium]|nr:methyltransferase domain-containing protein [Chitinivibrionales bacterium]MBD3393993.1 methyltransferase domain-containing protein [Chitinivibrionales bacterium]
MAAGDIHRHPALNGHHTPYSSLAPLYDRIMAHVEYRSWLRLTREIIATYLGENPPRVLEIGAGTGTLGRMLLNERLSYFGSDNSFAMCAEARKKGLPFFCADGRRLPVKGPFDLALFLYDGINYLLDRSDFERVFHETHSCLRDGGLLLFDVTTESNSLRHFYDYLDFEDYGESAYVRHSYYEPKSACQYNDFTLFVRAGNEGADAHYQKQRERHVQRVRSVDEIRGIIPGGRFAVVGVWDGFSFKRYSSRSDRIHFLLRKKGAG